MKTQYQYNVILRIRKAREKAGYSQAKIADLLGISYGQVGNIESPTKQHKYTLAQIEILCKALNITIGSIFSPNEESNITIDQLVHYIVKYQETNKK